MVVKRFLVEQLVNVFKLGVPFAAIRSLVEDMENSELSGPERKAKVLADFERIGYGIASWLAETLIQLALLWIRGAV